MTGSMRLASGPAVEPTGLEGEILAVVCPRAFAPGSPVALELELGGRWVEVSAKTVGVRRRADGRFDLRLRLVNLRRELREALREAVPSADPG